MLNRWRNEAARWATSRRRAAFYRRFITPGDLVFDIGANVGERTRIFAALGARVVAVEPQAHLCETLRREFVGVPVTVVEKAVGSREGVMRLRLNAVGALASMSPEWIDAMERSGRMAELGSEWLGEADVAVTTLDRLIEEHGRPAFCKIDVEGSEPAAIEGLSQPVHSLSFEFAGPARSRAAEVVARLLTLGLNRFNVDVRDASQFLWDSPADASKVQAYLGGLDAADAWGDVYAWTENA